MIKQIKIYGERNTNTNYLMQLISLNLDVVILRGSVPLQIVILQFMLPGREWIKNLYFSLTYKHNLGWKHTRVTGIASELQKYKIARNSISFLTITKNPYSWLLSLYRRPYHQYYKEKPNFETFLRTPWKTVGRENCDRILSSPVELWNIKNRSYIELSGHNTLSITTESIFENPTAIINKLKKQFSINSKFDNFINYERSTKDKNKNFTFYQDYYLNERWRDDLSPTDIFFINKKIDKSIVNHFGYELLPEN